MKIISSRVLVALLLSFPALCLAKGAKGNKTYKHVSEYQVAILDQHTQEDSGIDVTWGANTPSGQGVHLLHTDAGNFRVESPVNKGLSILSAMGSTADNPAVTYHNKWFLDNVAPGTKVLFAPYCNKPNKKHPNDAVRCTFYFPDPDSTEHEFATAGTYTPNGGGDGSNTQNTANNLCGTGKLKPEVEAQLCGNNSADDSPGIAKWDPDPAPAPAPAPSFAPIPPPPPPPDSAKAVTAQPHSN